MYSVEITNYGLKLRRSGFPDAEGSRELLSIYLQKLEEVKEKGKPFGHLIDLRGFTPGPPETQQIIVTIMTSFKGAGGIRSAVILDNPLAAMQIRRLGREAGIDSWEKYLDPETHPDYEKAALDWITDGVNPDKE
jgi:hypothetical protein